MKLREAAYKLMSNGGFIRNPSHPKWITLDEDGSLVYADTRELVVTSIHVEDLLSVHWQWAEVLEQEERAPSRPKLRLVVRDK